MKLTTHLIIENRRYRLITCEYEVHQPINTSYHIGSCLPGEALIHITIVAPDDDDPFFYEWLRNKEWKDGTFISSTDGDKPSVKTMNFENARCYRIQEFFSPLNPADTQMLTEIAIHARNVIFGRKENSKFVPLTIGTSEDTLVYDDSEEYTKVADLANGNTPETKAPVKPNIQIKGGAHKNLDFDKTTEQRHHMPAQAAGNQGGEGGAITMKTTDHKLTASCDNKPGAKEYRETQKKLIEEGRFQEAFEMDVKDIHKNFGDDYNESIEQLRKWYKSRGKF